MVRNCSLDSMDSKEDLTDILSIMDCSLRHRRQLMSIEEYGLVAMNINCGRSPMSDDKVSDIQ